MVRVYTFFQDGNFANGTFPLGPILEKGTVTNIRVGNIVKATGNAAGDVKVTNGATELQTAVVDMGGSAGPAANTSTKATLHATQTNRDVAEGAALSVVFANANAGTGALGIDTCVSVEVASET